MTRRYLLPAAVFLALAVLLTWPLASALFTDLPGRGADDNVNFVWNLWWMRDLLAGGSSGGFHTGLLFHPYGVDLTLHTHTALPAFVAATLLASLPVVAAQNVLLIVFAALNGFCAYLLALRLTGFVAASMVAGIYFAASPYFAGHLLGHFNLQSGWGLPLFALAFAVALAHRGISTAILAGVVLAAVAYTDYYYVVYLVAFAAIVLIRRAVALSVTRAPRRRFGWVDGVLTVLAFAMAVVAIWIAFTGGGVVRIGNATVSMTSGFNLRIGAWLLFFVILWRRIRPRLGLRRRVGAAPARDLVTAVIVVTSTAILTAPLSIAAIRLWSGGDYLAPARLWRSSTEGVDLLSLVAGNPFHPLWRSTGEWIYSTFGMSTIESTAWLGVVPMVLLWRERRTLFADAHARLWLAVAGIFFIWALGPYLRVAGANTGLMLPETILHYVPVVSNARIPGRAIVMVYLGVAMLLAVALARRQTATAVAPVVVGAVLVFELLSAPIPLYRAERSSIYERLATLPAGAVLELPFGYGDGFADRGTLDNAILLHQATHRKPLVGGFVARLPRRLATDYDHQPAIRTLVDLSTGRLLTADELAAAPAPVRAFLHDNDVKYVVLNRATATDQLVALAGLLSLTPVAADGRRELFSVSAR